MVILFFGDLTTIMASLLLSFGCLSKVLWNKKEECSSLYDGNDWFSQQNYSIVVDGVWRERIIRTLFCCRNRK